MFFNKYIILQEKNNVKIFCAVIYFKIIFTKDSIYVIIA